jgi:poly(rC)-binding protein 2/3/4
VASNKIGKVIGKQGSKINQLREDTGARIKIADPVTPLEDRVIIISSKGEEEEETSAAEQALIQIATVILEESGESSATAKVGTRHVGPNMMRLLIAGSQAGSLIGASGKTIKEIRNDSGATIKILPQNLSPICASASETDRLVQISGEVSQVLKALDHIGVTLREHPPREVISTRPTYYAGLSPANGLMVLPQTVLPGYNMQTGNSNYGYLGAAGRAAGGTISAAFALPKVTVEMKIPSSVAGGVIGKRGDNISQIRSLSGAIVKVIGEKDGATRTIFFEGTAHQVATAQNLVNNHINAQAQENLVYHS